MGRLLAVLLLVAGLLLAPVYTGCHRVEPVFFSLLFPQLVSGDQAEQEATWGEAVRL